MTHQAPAIVKQAESVLVAIEEAVRLFPQFHKYAVGSDLRGDARKVTRLAHRAWRDQPRQGEWIGRLVFAIDDLKLSVQIAKRVQAFKNFAQFEALMRLVSNLGQQCGAWRRWNLKSQNSQGEPAGRAQILSTRDASQGANP